MNAEFEQKHGKDVLTERDSHFWTLILAEGSSSECDRKVSWAPGRRAERWKENALVNQNALPLWLE